jgi:hypothetical protein
MVESFTEDDIAREIEAMKNAENKSSNPLSGQDLNGYAEGIKAPPKRRGPPTRKKST